MVERGTGLMYHLRNREVPVSTYLERVRTEELRGA